MIVKYLYNILEFFSKKKKKKKSCRVCVRDLILKFQPEGVVNVVPVRGWQRQTRAELLSPCKPRDVGVTGRSQPRLCLLPAQPDGGGRGERLFIPVLKSVSQHSFLCGRN